MLHSMLPIMIWLYPARGTGEPLELDFIIWIQIIRCFVTIMSHDKTKGYLDDDERCLISKEVCRNNGGMQAISEVGLNWLCDCE